MKHRINKLLTLVGLLAMLPTARAGDWSYGFGIGSPSDDYLIDGSGVLLSVVASVHSNALYYITSADNSGAAQLENVWIRNDFVSGTLNWYVATNTYTCASNQPAGTNIIWLTSTNSGLATNDLLILEGEGADSYQLLLLSGNATDAGGLVYTNAAGYNAVKVWNTPTNTIVSGDKLHKLARVSTFTPLGMGVITNQINAVPGDHFGQWLRFGSKENPIRFKAKIGQPAAVVMTFSNAAGLKVEGEYFRRPRF